MLRKIFKLFKTPELKGNYVKYSHATACENPQMILNEYEKVYNAKYKEIKDLDSNDYILDVGTVDVDDDNLRSFIIKRHYGCISSTEVILKQFRKKVYKKYKVSMHAKMLKEILDQYETDLVTLERLNKELSDINNETEAFKEEYKYVLMVSE